MDSITTKPTLAHRRAAIQLLSQLPEDQIDALLILQASLDFVHDFLCEDHFEETDLAGPPLRGRDGVVLAFAADDNSASADRNR